MDFSMGSIMASILVSGVGYVLFSYGKKLGRTPQIGIGLLMMVFPYFVGGVWWMFGIAAGMLVLLYVLLRAGL
ncbi:MAG TPA: hypothetical protein VHM70_25840 [Polyangiaceae bacterium]|jgi:hypothetical protein|nr:hypothetical protein [Polyangiaceae bacterium]